MTTRQLKAAAAAALSTTNHKRIVSIYIAVYLALNLALLLVNAGAESLLALTDGLDDFQKRTAIMAAELVITMAIQIFTPLWAMGLAACALGFARQQDVTTDDLLSGGRRWGGFVRLGLCMLAVYAVGIYGVAMVAMSLMLLTPMGETMVAKVDPIVSAGQVDPEVIPQLLQAMLPLYVVVAVLTLALILAMRYLLGIAHYRLLDQAQPRALAAMTDSLKLLTGHRWMLFKLDLSYWWFTLANLILSGIVSLPEILLLAGITLPISDTALYVLCNGVFMAALWLLYTAALAKRETAYAIFYNNLLPKEEPPAIDN